MKNLILLIPVFILLLLGTSCSNPAPDSRLMIFCAAGLTDLLENIAEDYYQETGKNVLLNFASSGFLAKQILSGATADIYISANRKWMDEVVGQEYVDDKDIFPLAKTSLVLLTNNSWTKKLSRLEDLLTFPDIKIAIGDPAHVPAGEYAKETCISLGIWEQLEKQMIPSLSVKAAMVYVENGETDGAIVYQSDAVSCKNSSINFIIKDELHQPIVFLASKLKNTTNKEVSSFLDFLKSRDKELFNKFGFRNPR